MINNSQITAEQAEINKKAKALKIGAWAIGVIIIISIIGGAANNNSKNNISNSAQSNSTNSPTSEQIASKSASLAASISASKVASESASMSASIAAVEANKAKIANAQPLPAFKVVDRDAEELKGNTYKFKGKVRQVMVGQNITSVRLDMDIYSYADQIIYLVYPGKMDVFEDDIINVVATSTGTYSYKSQANYNITLPSFIVLEYNK